MRKTTRWILAAALVAILVGALGCGGGSGGVAVDSEAPALDLTFRAPAGPLDYAVDYSSETEMRGTSFITSVRFQWQAGDWKKEENGDITCDVTFRDISAAQRRGSGVGMDTIDEFSRLEGFSTRYLKNTDGFEPVIPPAEDTEFMGMFGQLQDGLAPLDFATPDAPVQPGAKWTDVMDGSGIQPLKPVMQDSLMHLHYKQNELHQGRLCARIEYEAKIPLDGIIEVEEGPQAGTRVKITGKIEISGRGFYDPERGFLIHDQGKSKAIIEQQMVDKKGKPEGSAQTMVQNGTFTVSYLGD